MSCTPGSRPDPQTEVRLTLDQPPVRRILARQDAVPGFGWSRFSAATLAHPVREEVGEVDGAEGALPVTLTNGLVTVTVDPTDGTFALNGVPGYGRLVDDGDHGDTYNYSPPQQDAQVDAPDAVSVRRRRAGAGPGAWPPSPPPTPGPTGWTTPPSRGSAPTPSRW